MNNNISQHYPVITLCGSTKFRDEFTQAAAQLTLKGNIVLSLGVFDKSGDSELYDIDENDKDMMFMLSDMHKRRIDMSDAVFIINPNGYIGEGTLEEISYAQSKGKEDNVS